MSQGEPEAWTNERVAAKDDRNGRLHGRARELPKPWVGDSVSQQEIAGKAVLLAGPGTLVPAQAMRQQDTRVDERRIGQSGDGWTQRRRTLEVEERAESGRWFAPTGSSGAVIRARAPPPLAPGPVIAGPVSSRAPGGDVIGESPGGDALVPRPVTARSKAPFLHERPDAAGGAPLEPGEGPR